jgi:aspartyl-tRNA synthetase
MYRTHHCNELRKTDKDKTITLSGWVHRRRDHGDLIFIDLRDRYGYTQVSFDPSITQEAHKIAETVRSEWVIQIEGKVIPRPEGQQNKNMDTGDIEVEVSKIKILNTSKTPPFEIDQDKKINEEVRFQYRYLDLRKQRMKENIIFRSKITKFIRDFYEKQDFIDIETPLMIKGTPEGSREYLVPSRMYPGEFFVLPQSPQQLKQMCMLAGFDKYFQIAKCFRDEDLRGDRQPEFTQIDVEMSFVSQEDILILHEELFHDICKQFSKDKKLTFSPFKRITWQESMEKYGTDKPDLRFDLEIQDISDIVKNCEFKVFSSIAQSKNGTVRTLKIPGGDEKITRKKINNLTKLAQDHGAKGLAFLQVREEGLSGPVAKFLSEDELKQIINQTDAKTGDVLFFAADNFQKALIPLGQVRKACAEIIEIIPQDELAFAWVTDFPLFEKNDEGVISAAHHPFTRPIEKDLQEYENTDITKILSYSYDLTLNGTELGGGSVRIHEKDLQEKIFKLMKISQEDYTQKFGHILQAFEYGAPPHAGIAFGLDRLIMLMRNEPNIREVIAFPKDSKSKDLMLKAPSPMPQSQLDELGIQIQENE